MQTEEELKKRITNQYTYMAGLSTREFSIEARRNEVIDSAYAVLYRLKDELGKFAWVEKPKPTIFLSECCNDGNFINAAAQDGRGLYVCITCNKFTVIKEYERRD